MLALYSKNGIWKFLLNLGLEHVFSSQRARVHLRYSSLYFCVYIQWCHCLWHCKVQIRKHRFYTVLESPHTRAEGNAPLIPQWMSGLICRRSGGACTRLSTPGSQETMAESWWNHQAHPRLWGGFVTAEMLYQSKEELSCRLKSKGKAANAAALYPVSFVSPPISLLIYPGTSGALRVYTSDTRESPR